MYNKKLLPRVAGERFLSATGNAWKDRACSSKAVTFVIWNQENKNERNYNFSEAASPELLLILCLFLPVTCRLSSCAALFLAFTSQTAAMVKTLRFTTKIRRLWFE